MQDDVRARLQTLLARPDRDELLDDPRRLAELVRERLGVGFRREASFLNVVMQEGVPKRLLTMTDSALTTSTIANYAKRISDDTGLKEDVARSAVETWATCLGLAVATRTPPPPPPPPPPLPRPQPESGPAVAYPRAAAIAIVLLGAAVLLLTALMPWPFFDDVVIWRHGLPSFMIGASSVAVGIMLACGASSAGSSEVTFDGSAAAALRRTALAVCGIDALLGAWVAMSMFSYSGGHALLLLVATIALGAIAVTIHLRPPALPNAPELNGANAIALLLVVCGLYGVWIFGGETVVAGVQYTFWLAFQAPIAVALFVVGVRMLIVRSWSVPRVVLFAACGPSAAFYAGDLVWWVRELGWEWTLLDLVGIVGNLAVVALVWRKSRERAVAGLGGPNAASREHRRHA
jgi:hypothetical protein